MRCESIQEQLSAYIDIELEESIRETVDEHLRMCENCQHVLSELQGISSLFQTTFHEVLAPMTIEHNVLDAVSTSHQGTQVRRLSAVYLTCWALSVAVVMSLVLSPVGAMMRAFIRLLISAISGAVYLSPLISNVWLVAVTTTCIILSSLSLLGVSRILRSSGTEGVV